MSNRHFYVIKPTDAEPEHKPICSIDGEAWPCAHNRAESHKAYIARWSILCVACGKRRNSWGALVVEDAGDGRFVYFHARKRCIEKAQTWWDENVKPYTGERFQEGLWVGDLPRYIGLRCKPTAM
jgi:hypothetical protein